MYYRKNGTPIIEETFEKSMSDTKNEDSSDEFLSPIMKCFILFVMVSILIGLLYNCKNISTMRTVDSAKTTFSAFASALPI